MSLYPLFSRLFSISATSAPVECVFPPETIILYFWAQNVGTWAQMQVQLLSHIGH